MVVLTDVVDNLVVAERARNVNAKSRECVDVAIQCIMAVAL